MTESRKIGPLVQTDQNKNHTFPEQLNTPNHMLLFIKFVLSACISMRAASRIFNQISSFLELDILVPSWYTGRLWLLRVGLYKLERPKQIAEDWIWIIDHTILLGNLKCMVILGIRQSDFPSGELYLTHEDVEPISLILVEHSNGEVVFQQLEENIIKTGIPKQIVSDHGPDIKSGADKFCEKYDTIQTYDMKHKGATILKRELKDDPDWDDFVKKASKTSKKVQQTALSALAPPKQRSKARYMNVDKLVYWGHKTLSYLDHEKTNMPEKFGKDNVYQKLEWLYEFRGNLNDWKNLVDIIKTADKFTNFMGLYKGFHLDLQEELSELPTNDEFMHIQKELVIFAKEQQDKIGDDDRLLGSSEIIESVIGKYKGLQHDQVKGGFTGMLLGLAASVSELTLDTVQKAIATIPTKKVWDWIKKNIGKTMYSERKEINRIAKKQEQNSDEILCLIQG